MPESMKELRQRVDALAKRVLEGDAAANRELSKLRNSEPRVAKMFRVYARKAEKQSDAVNERETSKFGQKLQGGYMHGLTDVTTARNWKTTK